MKRPPWPYGKALRSYSGRGVVKAGGHELSCEFCLQQASSGRIFIRCESPEGLSFDWPGREATFVGETETGARVSARPARVTTEEARWKEGSQVVALTLMARQAQVVLRQGTVASFRYGLTNLDLPGNERCSTPLPDGGVVYSLRTRFKLDSGLDVVVEPLDGAREILSELRALRGIDVTALADVTASPDQGEAVDQAVSRLGLLLTLGQGCRIEWVYRDALDPDGNVLETLHRNAVTKPFGGTYELLAGPSIPAFVENAYPAFEAAEQRWGLKKAILAYNEAKLEGDYLESRALKMAVVMEHLRGCHVRRVRTQGGTRPGFRKALAAICAEIRLPLEDEEAAYFTKLRNALVHDMDFIPGPRAKVEQYHFLMTVIGKLLLAILGYEGEYRDWTKDPNAAEKLVLKP